MTETAALLILLTLITALMLVFVIRIYLLLRVILNEIRPTLIKLLGSGPSTNDDDDPIVFDHVHVFDVVGFRLQGVFVVWEWRGERWHCLPQPRVTDPGLPPSFSGAFEGDIAKTWTPLPAPTESAPSSPKAPSP
jgi:hypothetical protein